MATHNKSINHLVYAPAYRSDLSVLGSAISFAQDRGERILEELGKDFGGGRAKPMAAGKPRRASLKNLLLAHSRDYVTSLKRPATWASVFGLDKVLPESSATDRILSKLFGEYRLKVGGTLKAARLAMEHGLAVNLGAGYHHAHADHGDGFCILNDVAVSIRALQAEGRVSKVMIVDTDFHHGNGNASIFKGDNSVFILDVYSQEAWPSDKIPVSSAVPIKEHDGALYLEKVTKALTKALKHFQPDLVIFVQGADAWEYGVLHRGEGFSLPLQTVQARDELVIDTFFERGIPLAIVFAGGYGERAWEGHYHGVKHLLLRAGVLSEKRS
jgi:acetoin utilization deacetylase AcuC-like enzyme